MPLSDHQHDTDMMAMTMRATLTRSYKRILAAKCDEGLVSDKAYHELRMAFPEKVRSHVPPLTAIKQERRSQNKEIEFVQFPEVN